MGPCTTARGGAPTLLMMCSPLGRRLGEVGGLCLGENGGERGSWTPAGCELPWKGHKNGVLQLGRRTAENTKLA